jgi:hypothetical protein
MAGRFADAGSAPGSTSPGRPTRTISDHEVERVIVETLGRNAPATVGSGGPSGSSPTWRKIIKLYALPREVVVPPAGPGRRSPIDGSLVARVAKASADDVEAAIAAAREAREGFRAFRPRPGSRSASGGPRSWPSTSTAS